MSQPQMMPQGAPGGILGDKPPHVRFAFASQLQIWLNDIWLLGKTVKYLNIALNTNTTCFPL